MSERAKSSFYRKLHLPKEITEIMKAWKKIKKQLMKNADLTGVGK